MKMINAAVTTYVTEVVERLSVRYGFASAEALAYLGSAVETAAGTAGVSVVKQGRPEKKVKPVVNKGERVEDKIQTILAGETPVSAVRTKKAAPNKKPVAVVEEAAAAPVVVAEAVVEKKKEAVKKTVTNVFTDAPGF